MPTDWPTWADWLIWAGALLLLAIIATGVYTAIQSITRED